MTIIKMPVEDAAKQPQTRGAAGQEVWDLALDLMSGVAPCALLEAAAGGGHLAAQLAARGFCVTGADIVDQWRFPEIPFVRADLDQPLPFAADQFGAAMVIEAIGYVENPCSLLRELHRVVRRGGAVVITMPNMFSLQSRVRFLLNGSYRWFPHPAYEGENKEALADTYRDPLRLTTLIFYLERAGYAVERVAFGGRLALPILAPLGLPLQALVALHNAVRRERRKRTPSVVNSFPALLRTNVGIIARKR